MHSVERSPEPDFLAELRATHFQWDDLHGDERRRIRNARLTGSGRRGNSLPLTLRRAKSCRQRNLTGRSGQWRGERSGTLT